VVVAPDVAEVATEPGPVEAGAPAAPVAAGRGRRQSAVGRLRGDISPRLRAGAAAAGVVCLVALWVLASTVFATEGIRVPTLGATWSALVEMGRDGELWGDFVASLRRVGIGYAISLAIGVGIGVLIGSFASAEAFPTISPARTPMTGRRAIRTRSTTWPAARRAVRDRLWPEGWCRWRSAPIRMARSGCRRPSAASSG
jgi:hypothetical protein